jgi:tetratricopeptide (TPR) repeat protein
MRVLSSRQRQWRLGTCVGLAILSTCTAPAQTPDWGTKSREAKDAMSAGRFDLAVVRYRELIEAFPDNPGMAMNLGLALHAASKYDEAIPQFQKTLRMQPGLAAAWFLLGLDYQKLNRPKDAVPPLRRARKLDPNNENVHLELADALFQSGSFAEAADEFRSLAIARPANPKAWLGLGLSYSSLAGQDFEALERDFSHSPQVHMLVAQSRADQHQYRSAYQQYRQALSLDPGLIEAHYAIADIYRATGHPDWAAAEQTGIAPAVSGECAASSFACFFAKKEYESLLSAAAEQRTSEAYYWSARAYQALALHAQETLAQLPPSAELHQLLAVMYDLRELYPDAAQEWREALKIQPGNRNFRKKLAWSLSGAGEWEAAATAASELQNQDPENTEIAFLLGDALLNLQRPESAIPQLEKVVTREPKNLRAHASLGRALLLAQKLPQAIQHLEQALPSDRDGAITYQLAQAYRNAGEPQKAAGLMKKYGEMKKSSEEARTQANEITAPQ